MESEGMAGPKLVRLLYFVGAGFISTVGINKWRDLQRKQFIQQQMDQLSQKPVDSVHKAVE